MSDGFYEGFYDAVVVHHQWMKSSKKQTLGLQVDVDVRNAEGQTKAMTGYIWFSPKTMESKGFRDDGTPHRSMAERALNAIGYEGEFGDARDIGVSVDLRHKEARVRLKNETYNEETRLKISGFYSKDGGGAGMEPAGRADIDALFSGLGTKEPPVSAGEARLDEAPQPAASPAPEDDLDVDDDGDIPF